jgi:hypothetical protein
VRSVVFGVLVAALISSFLAPGFGSNAESIPTYLGFLLGLTVVLIVFELPPLLMRRRKTGELGRLRVLPWTLVVAALFVLVSRLAGLQPGYLYGLVLGTVFTKEPAPGDEAKETVVGMIATLVLAVAAWLALDGVRGDAFHAGEAWSTVVGTAAATIVVSGLEAAAFGMLPLRFMPGRVVYEWSRPAWAALFGVGVLAFVQILVGPTSGYLAELNADAWLAALGVFAAFGLFSLVFWSWFRFRPDASVPERPADAWAGSAGRPPAGVTAWASVPAGPDDPSIAETESVTGTGTAAEA